MSDSYLIDGRTGSAILKESEIAKQLSMQHPIHGLIGRAYDRMGEDDGVDGEEWFVNWCKDHESAFVKILLGAMPNMQPVQGVQGEVHLHVHNTLGPTELDAD